MIYGEVNAERLAVVPLRIISHDGRHLDEFAVVDTFFSGHLSLSVDLIQSLELPFSEQRSYSIADDTLVNFDLYEGRVFWGDVMKSVLIVAAEGPPTIGMALLYGYQLTIEVVDGGAVIIARK